MAAQAWLSGTARVRPRVASRCSPGGARRARSSAIRRGRRDTGQGLVEYGLILSLSALLAIVILVFFGGAVADVLQAIGNAIDAATGE